MGFDACLNTFRQINIALTLTNKTIKMLSLKVFRNLSKIINHPLAKVNDFSMSKTFSLEASIIFCLSILIVIRQSEQSIALLVQNPKPIVPCTLFDAISVETIAIPMNRTHVIHQTIVINKT